MQHAAEGLISSDEKSTGRFWKMCLVSTFKLPHR